MGSAGERDVARSACGPATTSKKRDFRMEIPCDDQLPTAIYGEVRCPTG